MAPRRHDRTPTFNATYCQPDPTVDQRVRAIRRAAASRVEYRKWCFAAITTATRRRSSRLAVPADDLAGLVLRVRKVIRHAMSTSFGSPYLQTW
jgi:hypothetical protein